ncbi:MAG: glycyl-radical enzyme activating protein [Lachnospiraceae bacterium]
MEISMEGIIGGIQKFSTEDGPGIRTTVFLKGCPLECKWCHNPELINFGANVYHNPTHCIGCGACIKACRFGALSVGAQGIELNREKCSRCLECTRVCYAGALTIAGKTMSVEEVMKIVSQDKDFYDKTDGGLTISGGELLSQADFARELQLSALREGIQVILDTCGYGPGEKLLEMARDAQFILYDLKHFYRDEHIACTGKPNDIILQNLKTMAGDDNVREKIIMRMPLISGVNDGVENITETSSFYKEIGIRHVNLIAYHELGKVKASCIGRKYNTFKAPSREHLELLKQIFEKDGLEAEIIGEGV